MRDDVGRSDNDCARPCSEEEDEEQELSEELVDLLEHDGFLK